MAYIQRIVAAAALVAGLVPFASEVSAQQKSEPTYVCVCARAKCGAGSVGANQGDYYLNVSAKDVAQKFAGGNGPNAVGGWSCLLAINRRGE